MGSPVISVEFHPTEYLLGVSTVGEVSFVDLETFEPASSLKFGYNIYGIRFPPLTGSACVVMNQTGLEMCSMEPNATITHSVPCELFQRFDSVWVPSTTTLNVIEAEKTSIRAATFDFSVSDVLNELEHELIHG